MLDSEEVALRSEVLCTAGEHAVESRTLKVTFALCVYTCRVAQSTDLGTSYQESRNACAGRRSCMGLGRLLFVLVLFFIFPSWDQLFKRKLC